MTELQLLTVGASVGLVAVAPPGPITLTLIELGTAQGRTSGIRAGLGVAAGEAAACAGAVAVVGGLGAQLHGSVMAAIQILSAMILLGLGLALVTRPEACRALAVGIRRPGWSMMAFTAATPTVVGTWIVILAALPVGGRIGDLILVATGVVLASLAWHLALGAGAGTVGPLLSGPRRRRFSQAGGLVMIGFAALSSLG